MNVVFEDHAVLQCNRTYLLAVVEEYLGVIRGGENMERSIADQ